MSLGKHILALMMLFIGAFSIFASNNGYIIYSIGNEETNCKFEDNRVNCIYKDSDGFIWVGTGGSVERINGKYTSVYHFTEKQAGITPSPFLVNALIENHKHDFWAGTIQGLFHMNHEKRTLERIFTEEINFPVQVLERDQENRLYIGTVNGLYIYDGKQLRHIIVDEKNVLSVNNRILGIAVHNHNSVWLLTPNEVVICDAKSGALKRYKCPLLSCGQLKCFIKVDDTLYIGTEKGGIITFNLLNQSFALYWNKVKVPVSNLTYEKEILGVATSGEGIYLLSLPGGKTIYSATCGTETGQDLLSNNISSILLSQGDVWCGTGYYLGINLLRKKNESFKRYDKGLFSTKDVAVRSYLPTEGYRFIGTREGFYYVNEKNGKVQYMNARDDKTGNLRSNLIFSFYEYEGTVLIGTCGGGLSAFIPQTGTFKETALTRACASNDIFMFLEDENKKLWLATSDGLYSYDKQARTVREYNASNSGMPGNIVYGIYLDSAGRFWIGTDKGLAVFDRHTGKCSQNLLPERYGKEAIRYIYEGRDGTLFFCQLNYRLLVADKSLNHFHYLPSICPNLIQDDQGFYWLGQWDGLLRIDENLNRYTFFPSINDMNTNAGPPIFKDKNGMLWICGMKGLFMVNPQTDFIPSPVQITEMQINGNFYADDYELKPDSTIYLKSNENTVTFRFTSLGYEKPELIKYEYMLQGKDSAWTVLTNEDKVSYFDLPTGEYIFQIRKFLNSDSIARVSFEIKANHFWMTYASIVIITMIVLSVLILRKRKIVSASTPTNNESSEDIQPEARNTTQPTESYVKLSEKEANEVIDALKKYMQEQQAYLNVDLKQSEVAAVIGYPTYLLSAIFTHYLKIGYYDFINNYRVEQFKQSVSEGKHKKYTLVTLAEKCGFKSKASFFRAFKKFTGTTPNEYIQQFDKE